MTLCKAGIADKAFLALADYRCDWFRDDALCQQNSRQVGQILVEDGICKAALGVMRRDDQGPATKANKKLIAVK